MLGDVLHRLHQLLPAVALGAEEALGREAGVVNAQHDLRSLLQHRERGVIMGAHVFPYRFVCDRGGRMGCRAECGRADESDGIGATLVLEHGEEDGFAGVEVAGELRG